MVCLKRHIDNESRQNDAEKRLARTTQIAVQNADDQRENYHVHQALHILAVVNRSHARNPADHESQSRRWRTRRDRRRWRSGLEIRVWRGAGVRRSSIRRGRVVVLTINRAVSSSLAQGAEWAAARAAKRVRRCFWMKIAVHFLFPSDECAVSFRCAGGGACSC